MSHYNEEEDWMRISQPESRKRVQNRLSQRRHRAKFRAQNNSAAEEDLPSPSASPTLYGGAHVLTDDYLNPSVPFTRHDDLSSLPMLAQSHDNTNNVIGFDIQHLLPSDHDSLNPLSQQPQQDWSTSSRPTTSLPMASSRVSSKTSLQNGGDFSTAEIPASRPLPEDSANKSWNVGPSPDPQWTVTNIHHNPMHTKNSGSGSSVHPGGSRRPQSRRQHSFRPTTTCQSSHEQCQPSPHAHFRHPSSSQSANSHIERPTSSGHEYSLNSPQDRTRKYSSSQIPYRSTSDFRPASPLITNPAPLRDTSTHCSHCSCIDRSGSPLASPKLTSPRNSARNLMSPITHTPSRNLEILAECSQALRNLVHAPDTNNLIDKRQPGSGESSRKSGRSSFALHSPCSERNSVDEGYDGEMERRNRLEKVVIVYVNGKLEGKWAI